MEEKEIRKGNIRLIIRRSPPLVRTAILAMLALCIISLATLGYVIHTTRAETQALRDQAAALEQRNAQLEEYLSELGSVEAIARIAQEELGLYLPGTVIYDTN